MVKIHTNKARLNVYLRQSLVLRLNLDVSLSGPGLEDPVGFNTESQYMAVYISVSIFKYNILRLLSWAYISMGLYPNVPHGYQYYRPQ
jgi:hypothetical protein